MNSLYWVGPRQSDICGIEKLFSGSVTIYGDNTNNNIAYCKNNRERFNHNIANPNCHLFFVHQLEELCRRDENVRFLFYNFEYAYEFDENIQSHVIGLNSFQLLETLSDKIKSRYLMDDIIEAIPFITLRGKECTFDNIKNYFLDNTDFVIQKAYSSGGEGTYHISASTTHKFEFNDNATYLISPYIDDSISLNTHIVITDTDVLFFPPSIQIITEINNQLLYQGADFFCYNSLPQNIKQYVKKISLDIGNFLCDKGYRGLLGIDFLLKDDKLYFMEINPRFQASSQLVNKSLSITYKTSLQEIHMQAFGEFPILEIEDIEIPYSNYAFSTHNISKERLTKIVSSNEIYEWQMDGYEIDQDYPVGENIYLCRGVFRRNICALNNNSLIVHPNFYIENIKSVLIEEPLYYKEYCKFALLNHGVTLTEKAILLSKKLGVIRDAVFDAIDITIFNGLAVNVPIHCKFVSLSPFWIDVQKDKFVLFFDGIIISEVTISFVPDTLLNKQTKSGVLYDAIINLANDRIRINPAPICIYKKKQIPCKFCNLPTENAKYNFEDIKEVIDYCIEHVAFRHFLIGGGTYSLDGGWEIITKIASYIRSKCNKDIYLMSIPPKSQYILDQLKEAGITEVAFNLEIFDREMATHIMPGKGTIEITQYMSAFEYATKIWGKSGNVRSLLIYGLDTEEHFINGIKHLCNIGVEPIISIFRPLENTELSHLNPPNTLDIFSIYHKCFDIAQTHSLILGPDCPQCQNNTLSYTAPQ